MVSQSEIQDELKTVSITRYSLTTSDITHKIKHQMTILFMNIIVNTKLVTNTSVLKKNILF